MAFIAFIHTTLQVYAACPLFVTWLDTAFNAGPSLHILYLSKGVLLGGEMEEGCCNQGMSLLMTPPKYCQRTIPAFVRVARHSMSLATTPMPNMSVCLSSLLSCAFQPSE